ncbi:unnamed protein product [Chondrus crispus]|uniref:Integrase catalytic domain-containing protein n=1 Tax=Chondrus crispus TaxID=2769 RepID=R7Q800_CHOCR|nr:unnamed protein product [Chondrus crispus]CDF34164.1 unnamed protein product [Chondrus crispus]|eukprot:XP_005713983.1 unnamed protein product [Chondrus crispus]
MPFGLTNAPATFQRAMDILLSPKSWEEHIVHVDEILSVLEKAGVKLKLRKCEFFVEKIKYLGHVVRPGTLEVDAARTVALEQVPYPQTQTQLRSFLELCGVYRRFVPHYAKIAHPLNQLLKKGQPVHDYQISAALFQTHSDAQRKPIGFFSRTLTAAERNYSVSEKECLAVIWAVQTLRPYLYGEHFIVHTGHASLRWLMNVTDPSGRLIRWRLRLSEFDFEIKYKKGKANSQADALSRLRTAGETVEEIDDEIPCFMAEPAEAVTPEELIREQAVDPFCNRIKEEMDAGKVRTFSMKTEELEGTLCRTAAEFVQVVIPQSLRDRVLGLSHYAKLAGHPGGRKLYKTLRRYFYWPTMASDCYAVAKNCAACARERLITTKRGNQYILVISDRYSKLVRTVPLKKISAAHIAQAFVHYWVFVYGPPVKLLSDIGTQFTTRFFQNVCRILGIRNVFTTTYHPQASGQVERFNHTLTSALQKYVGEHPKDWDLFSDAVTLAYNTQVHRTTNMAPFELVLARAPRSIALQAQPSLEGFSSNRAYYLKWQSWLESLMKGADRSLRKEQARYKRNFDARLCKPQYEIPPWSYVFLRKEQGTASEPKHKLAQVATGPYHVQRSDQHMVVIAIGDQEESVLRDRVELAPSPMDYAPITGLRQALQFLGEPKLNEEGEVMEDEERPHTRATTTGDHDNLVGRTPTTETPPDLREFGKSREEDELEDLRKGEGQLDTQEEETESQEYVIDKIVDHSYDEEKLILKVRW